MLYFIESAGGTRGRQDSKGSRGTSADSQDLRADRGCIASLVFRSKYDLDVRFRGGVLSSSASTRQSTS